MQKRLLLVLLLFLPLFIKGQLLKERRVYYIDCSYSMKQNGIWDLVRDKLKDAIDGVDDESTEIFVCPYAFDAKSSVKMYRELANESGKRKLKSIIDDLPMSNDTKTYHEMPLRDYYNNRVSPDRINYVFFMTDGISDHEKEDHNFDPFPSELQTWYSRYKDKHVYGFYIMLHKSAEQYKAALSVIGSESQQRLHHLWARTSPNVNINLVRFSTNAVYNAKTEEYFDIQLYGKTEGKTFNAKFSQNNRYKVTKTVIKDNKLRVYVKIIGDVHSLPEKQTVPLELTMNGGEEFDFLVTETVNVLCLNKPERTLKISIR